MALSWGFPVIASAPNPFSISTWQDIFVIATNQPHYDIPKFNLKSTGAGTCVDLIKVNGYGEYRGNARDWAKYINTDKPSIGDVVVLKESFYGHLALITGFDKGIMITEQNYRGLYIVSTRSIDWDYDRIVGFITK